MEEQRLGAPSSEIRRRARAAQRRRIHITEGWIIGSERTEGQPLSFRALWESGGLHQLGSELGASSLAPACPGHCDARLMGEESQFRDSVPQHDPLDPDDPARLSTYQPPPPTPMRAEITTRSNESQQRPPTIGGASGAAMLQDEAVKPFLGVFQGAQHVSVEVFYVTVAPTAVNITLENPDVRYSMRKRGDRTIEVAGALLGTAGFFF